MNASCCSPSESATSKSSSKSGDEPDRIRTRRSLQLLPSYRIHNRCLPNTSIRQYLRPEGSYPNLSQKEAESATINRSINSSSTKPHEAERDASCCRIVVVPCIGIDSPGSADIPLSHCITRNRRAQPPAYHNRIRHRTDLSRTRRPELMKGTRPNSLLATSLLLAKLPGRIRSEPATESATSQKHLHPIGQRRRYAERDAVRATKNTAVKGPRST